MAEVQSPAATYLVMDAGPYTIGVYYTLNPSGSFWYIPGTKKYVGTPAASLSIPMGGAMAADYEGEGRHFDGISMTFADGHAKWLKSSTVYNEAVKSNNGQPSAWNPATATG